MLEQYFRNVSFVRHVEHATSQEANIFDQYAHFYTCTRPHSHPYDIDGEPPYQAIIFARRETPRVATCLVFRIIHNLTRNQSKVIKDIGRRPLVQKGRVQLIERRRDGGGALGFGAYTILLRQDANKKGNIKINDKELREFLNIVGHLIATAAADL